MCGAARYTEATRIQHFWRQLLDQRAGTMSNGGEKFQPFSKFDNFGRKLWIAEVGSTVIQENEESFFGCKPIMAEITRR